MLMEGRGLVPPGLPVCPDGVEHHSEHTDENHDTDREQQPMQPHDVARNRRDTFMQVQLIDLRAAGHVLHLSAGHAANQHRTSPQYPSPLLHAYLETRREGPCRLVARVSLQQDYAQLLDGRARQGDRAAPAFPLEITKKLADYSGHANRCKTGLLISMGSHTYASEN
ncbi:hypothetical protein G6F57_017920 [Rhizopus arrhizus]|nr:hypothetical protein G6F57_017920 [Rhizopus arrhizus]